jgi:hypothetical protein
MQADVTKTVLSLSSAAMVLIATFGKSPTVGTPRLTAMLYVASLIGFALTVLSAVLSLALSIGRHDFRIELDAITERMVGEASMRPMLEIDEPDELHPLLRAAADKALRSIKWCDRLFGVALVLFIAALFALCAFAVVAYAI